jgi:hypothetical protein
MDAVAQEVGEEAGGAGRVEGHANDEGNEMREAGKLRAIGYFVEKQVLKPVPQFGCMTQIWRGVGVVTLTEQIPSVD